MAEPRPHDLLRVRGWDSLLTEGTPDWVRGSLATTPWVVVRRAAVTAGSIAVGVRGASRAQRHPLIIPAHHVETIIAPEQLSQLDSARDCAAFQALAELRPLLDSTGLRWGPTGSTGFELATATMTVTDSSDLDLLVRIERLDAQVTAQLTLLDREINNSRCRVDCQVELPIGAIALAELIGSQDQVLVRTKSGPELVARDDVMPR